MERKYIAPEDISCKLGNKKHLYDVIKIDLNIFTPPYKKCTIRFIKDLLAKNKLAITNDKVKLLPIPKYKELTTKNVWMKVKQVPDLMKYFSNLEDNELPDRDFMWTILSILREDEVKKLVKDARKNRDVGNEEDKQELIAIHPEFLSTLLAAPNTNKDNGRVDFLLKAKNSERKHKNPTKAFQANLDLLKGRRNESDHEQCQNIEEEKYQHRSIIDARTPSKQDTRSFRRQEGNEDDSIRPYHPTPAKSTLGFKNFTISKE